MDRTLRLARRNANKESTPRQARLDKYRFRRTWTLREELFAKHHWPSVVYHTERGMIKQRDPQETISSLLGEPDWAIKAAAQQFPKNKLFRYKGEDWWITCHGFIAKDDGIVKGWVEDGHVKWIRLVPVLSTHKYYWR